MRILVVDDEPLIAETICLILRHAGHEVEYRVTPADALTATQQRPADLLITDMNMPSMSGLELARRVSALDPACRILILSGRQLHEYPEAGQSAASFRFVHKPVSPRELIALVSRTMKQPSGQAAPRRDPAIARSTAGLAGSLRR